MLLEKHVMMRFLF